MKVLVERNPRVQGVGCRFQVAVGGRVLGVPRAEASIAAHSNLEWHFPSGIASSSLTLRIPAGRMVRRKRDQRDGLMWGGRVDAGGAASPASAITWCWNV